MTRPVSFSSSVSTVRTAASALADPWVTVTDSPAVIFSACSAGSVNCTSISLSSLASCRHSPSGQGWPCSTVHTVSRASRGALTRPPASTREVSRSIFSSFFSFSSRRASASAALD